MTVKRLPRGSELWLLFVDPPTQKYVAKCVGKITNWASGGYLVGQKFYAAAYPHFGSEAEMLAWIEANPRNVPTVSPQTTKTPPAGKG